MYPPYSLNVKTKIASIFLDRTECPNARSESANIMANLLRISMDNRNSWYGPTFIEPVSKLLVDGEGALYKFLDQVQLDREIVDIYQTTSIQHSSMRQYQSESCNDVSQSISTLHPSTVSFSGNHDNAEISSSTTILST